MSLRSLRLVLPVAAFLVPLYSAYAQETGNVCVRDFQPGAVCTANDVRIQELTLVTLIEGCGDGTIGEAEGLFEVLISAEGSPDRFDIGIFLATDGGSARDGDACYHDYLEPPLTATPTFGDANFDGIPDLSANPWQEIDADQCGDIQTNTQVIKPMPVTRFSCTDSDNDGFVDANVCPSWDNNAVTNCSSLSQAFPGTNSKCGCATVSLGIPVFAPAPAISVSKSPPNQTVSAGEDANFIITVDNIGNVQLENVIVDDPQCTTLTGPTGDDGDDILQTTETWSYTCSTTAVTMSFTNVVTATGTPSSGGADVTDTDSADVDVPELPSPAIAVAKTPPNQTVSIGEDANFVISVDNTGDVALENVIVDDPQCTTLSGPTGDDGDDILQTDEIWSYTCTVTGATTSFTNSVTVTGTPSTGGSDVSDTDSADVDVTDTPSPAISVAKTPPIQTVTVPTDVNFTIVVDNSGNVDLENVDVSDPQCTTLTGPVSGDDGDNILQTTETWNYVCDVLGVTAGFTNDVSVTATPTTGGADVTDTASADVDVLAAVPTLPFWMTTMLAVLLIAAGLLRLRHRAGASSD